MATHNTGIYEIASPSGKRYIGSAQHLPRRWATHRHQLRRGTHHCKGLQHAFDKYGEGALTFAVLEYCAEPDLILREQAQMDTHPRHKLYNSRLVAASNLGVVVQPEVRAKMSLAHKGKRHTAEHRANVAAAKRSQTPETRAKISAALKGRPPTPGSIEALKIANTGRPLTAEHIERIRAGNKGRARSTETKARMAAARQGKRHSEATLAKLRRPCSPETRAKIAEALRRRNAIQAFKASQ